MTSTLEYYKMRRAAVIECLGGKCVRCGALPDGGNVSLECHHNDPADWGCSDGVGGWQSLYRLERDILDGRDIRLLCKTCHIEVHTHYGGVV